MSDPRTHGASAPAERQSSPLAAAVSERDRDTLNLVRDAVARGNVLLAFQPVVQTAQPDRVAFYEGLIRVLDQTGRVIPARDFIEVIETHELGRRIDCLALKLGLETLAATPGLRLAINMSARSVGYRAWMDTLKRGLALSPTVAERLILEITESSAMLVPDVVQAFMRDLQHCGITFALDDFGSGYTSFRYLRDFYFDILKIDGHFIRGIHKSPDDQVLVQALLSIARHFEMFTVAEFVESAEDAEFLTQIGIDCMQGYFFGVPTTRPSWVAVQQARRVG
ncbi:MAG: EAL domain-containing protein [Rhodobacteraceae bacterium]|nr:EAL domain-containing protein [Paracoccaceae bacterium]